MFGHILDVTKNMLKQQQKKPKKHPTLTEQKANTNIAPVHRDEFYIKLPIFYLGTHDETRGYSGNKVSLIFSTLLKQVDLYRAFK